MRTKFRKYYLVFDDDSGKLKFDFAIDISHLSILYDNFWGNNWKFFNFVIPGINFII